MNEVKKRNKTNSRYFALRKTNNSGIAIDVYDNVEDLSPVASLEAEIV